MRTYALVIVDINSEQVDRRFTYAVPAGIDLSLIHISEHTRP